LEFSDKLFITLQKLESELDKIHRVLLIILVAEGMKNLIPGELGVAETPEE
jgi:hypothetical protein